MHMTAPQNTVLIISSISTIGSNVTVDVPPTASTNESTLLIVLSLSAEETEALTLDIRYVSVFTCRWYCR